jgi:hypothetical protein
VPRHNWGGAYVLSDDNSYREETLLAKDGFAINDEKNYLTVDIQIEGAVNVFSILFAELHAAGLRRGAIKIDVEGLEMVVLEAIAETVPADFELSVIFENWGEEFSGERLLSAFNGRAQLFSLVKTPAGAARSIVQLLKLLVIGSQRFVSRPWQPGLRACDLVLHVEAAT